MTEKYYSDQILNLNRTLGWMDLVIGSINDAVCVTDRDGKIVFANTQFASTTRIDRIFLLGQPLSEVFKAQKTERPLIEYRQSLNRLSEGGEEYNGIYEEPRGDRTIIYRVSSRTLPNIDQKVFLIQDITSEYEFARTKNKFVDLASHQLRTPMTAIMTYAHMLRDGFAGDLTPDQSRLVSTVVEASEHMIQLVNGLLSITRAQNNLIAVKSEPVNLADIFQSIQTETSPVMHRKQLSFLMSIPDDLPPITSDRSILHEIFSNLIVNAVQYTPSGGSIKVKVKPDGDKRVKVSIADTGIGIPEAHKPYIFDQFSRAENALESHPEGTGLGLYLIKILLTKIDGSIDFRSKVGRGTTFTVCLPRLQSSS